MQWSPRPRNLALIGVLALFAALLRSGMAVAPVTATGAYSIVDWGTLNTPGSTRTEGAGPGMNGAGSGVGQASTAVAGQTHAVLFRHGALIDLGAFGNDSSYATSVNSGDIVVGADRSADNVEHPVRFAGGAVTPLLANNGAGVATDINDAGVIVGSLQTTGDLTLAVRYVGDGTYVDLGRLGDEGPGGQTAAMAVNNAGDIVGAASSPDGSFRAARFAYGRAVELPRFGTNPLNVAAALSETGGYVVGSTQTADAVGEAVQYGPGAVAVDLGKRDGDVQSFAYGVNSSGTAVGVSVDPDGVFHAVMFDGGAVVDLDTLVPPGSGWQLHFAQGINDAGQIVGYGSHNGLSDRAFTLSPPPPPPPPTTTTTDGPLTHAVSTVPAIGGLLSTLLRAVSALLKVRL
jgi:probable HAF family extracellular repeat protein